MTGRLRGKVAIVAGAGSIGPGWGNGKATATVFAREGAKVICADINRDAAEETASMCQCHSFVVRISASVRSGFRENTLGSSMFTSAR